MWTTQAATPSVVEYGTDPASLLLSVSNETPSIQHRVPLTSLLSNTPYYYRAGNGTAWSSIHEFKTAPNDDSPFTFLVYGDHRPDVGDVAPAALGQLVELMAARQPRFVISLGDHVLHSNPTAWASYAAQTDRIHGNASYWVTMGNHDNPGTLDMASWYEWPDKATRNYYSFDYGNSHVVVLDSYAVGTNLLGAAQIAWLNADLAATMAKHRFICVHDPLFPTGSHIGSSLDVNATLRDALWQLFENRSVEVVFVAHEHYYYRLQVGTITQITSGGGAAPLALATRFNTYPVEVYHQLFHYVKVDVAGDTVTYTTYDINDQVLDCFSTESALGPRPKASELQVSPPTPKAEAPFNITVRVANSTSLTSVTCRYRERPASAYASATMIAEGDAPQRYLATLGPLSVSQPFFLFYVEVNDTAHANYRSLLTQFAVDKAAPNVTIQEPTNASTVAGLVAVHALVQDDLGTTHVEFYVDGVLKVNMSLIITNMVVSWDWNTYDYSNGIHTIEIIVYDGVGRFASAMFRVTVNNVPAPPIQPILIAIGAGVLLAGVIVVTIIVVRRRHFEPGRQSS
jgi:hypothetical protein